jgi:cell fate regulator YaaT (PSP1 superfamily)
MSTVFLKVHPWENSRGVQSAHAFSAGDVVIVDTEGGTEAAIVESCSDTREIQSQKKGDEQPEARIIRKANLSDLKTLSEHKRKEKEAVEMCRKEVKKTNLPMKIVDAAFSFDGGSIIFAFIADGRVDFRDLVKILSKHLQRSIRLHQIGARDESRQGGGYGICGRELCCVKFKGNLPSITSEMAKIQQIAHRGSERISGICGRLMCCLAFEADQYRELLEEYPKVGDQIKTKDAKGVVKEVNILTEEIRIELDDKSIVSVNKKDL